MKAGTIENGITYDAKTVTAKVTVIDDKEGKLQASVEYSSDGSTTFTNVYTPDKTQVSVKKVWDDNNDQDGIRPTSITVELIADGKPTGKIVTVSEATGWKYRFDGLAKKQNGKAIKYTIQEVNIPKGYTSKVDGYNITNVHTPEVPPTTPPTTPPSKPEEPKTPEKPKKKTILPSTGMVENFSLFLWGLGTLGGVLYLGKKKA